LPEGDISIVVSAPGHLTWEHRLTVSGGKDVELVVDLVPDRRDFPNIKGAPPAYQQTFVEPERSNTRISSTANLNTTSGSTAELDSAEVAVEPHSRIVAWTLIGVGVALAGAGVWSYVSREPSCLAGGRVCNRSPRSSWPTVALAGSSALAAVGGVALLVW
jgi:hypothetical protein